jgi:hypothetical protein
MEDWISFLCVMRSKSGASIADTYMVAVRKARTVRLATGTASAAPNHCPEKMDISGRGSLVKFVPDSYRQ